MEARQAGIGRGALAGTLLALIAVLALALGGCGIGGPGADALAAAPTPPSATPTPTLPPIPAPKITAQEAILLDPATGREYLNVHSNDPMPMASTTKIMTAIVALTYGKQDQLITVGKDAADMNNGENSVAGLRQGEKYTLTELLYALLLPSGDDAAVAVADGVAGSQERFVTLMNLEAAVLGLTGTHYVNVHGLDDDVGHAHLSTAHDLAILTESAMNFALFRTIVATPTYPVRATATHHGGFTWTTTNELLLKTYRYASTLGIKTGHTGGAKYCLVFMAQRDSGRLIGVVLGEEVSDARFTDAIALLNWGFQVQQKLAA